MGLRDDQERRLERHRALAADRVEEVITASPGGDPRRSAEGQALLAEEPELLVSVAVCALALGCEVARGWRDGRPGRVVWSGARVAVPAMLVRLLGRRRLPWAPADVELAVDLTADAVHLAGLAFAVSAAERALAEHPGDPSVYRALSSAGIALDEAQMRSQRSARVRQRIRTLVAASAPGGLLDLSLLEEGDAWYAAASTAVREHASRWDGVQELMSHLASARGARPSRGWSERTRALLRSSVEGCSLVPALLTAAVGAEPTADRPLLTRSNERIVCGAAWAAGLDASEGSAPLLRDVALACMGPARVAARAAVEGLALADEHAAREALQELLPRATRVTVHERIAELVETAPTARSTRSEATRAFGDGVLAALADRGFTDRRGRECYRHSLERVEVLWMRSAKGRPLLDVGVAFAAPRHGRLGRPKTYFCDFRGMARPAPDDTVDAWVGRILAWFERWSNPAEVVDFALGGAALEEVEGFETSGAGGPDDPVANLLAGYLAEAAGRPELVQPCLTRAAELYRDLLERTDPRSEELAALVERLESDIDRLAP